jgi:hypothetical protein
VDCSLLSCNVVGKYVCICLADMCTLTFTEFVDTFTLNAFLSCMSRSRTILGNIGMLLADIVLHNLISFIILYDLAA